MKNTYLWSSAGMAVALGLSAGQALAQTTPTDVGEVVVTGSFIAGTAKDTAIPIAVMSQQEIEKRGSPNSVELIKSLPISGPAWGDSNQFAAPPTIQDRIGTGSINLRGLGPERTLLLMNGKRFSGSLSDTNMLPIAAIGRVEILKDGAAATYGSDAIGGVVNFITRSGFKGLELQGDYRLVDGSKGDWQLSGIYGWGDDRVNALISAAYIHRSELSTTKRSWAVAPYLVNPSGWSLLGNPGEFTIYDGAPGVSNFVGFAQDANCEAVGGFQGYTGTTPVCRFTYVPFDNLVETQNQYQLYGEFNADIGESSHFHVEALYSKTDVPAVRFSPSFPPTSGPTGPGSFDVYSVPAANPGFATFLAQTGNAALIGVAQSATATFWRPMGNGGNIAVDGRGGQKGSRTNDQFRLVAELKGDTGFYGIGYNASVTYIRELHEEKTTDILIDRLQRALNGLGGVNCTGNTPGANGCQWYNPFSNGYAGNPALRLTNPGFVSANANDPALVGWLYDAQHLETETTTVVAETVFNGKLPISLPGGEVAWAAGAQYRKLTYNQEIRNPLYDARVTPCPIPGDTTCTFRTGPYIFLGQAIPLNLEQNVWAAFAELNLPITETLNAQLAIRHEDYGGLTGSTTNPQLRAKWQATEWLGLRGSVGTSFRGPTPANVAPTGITQLSPISAAGDNFKSVDLFGNPATKPEKAFTYNVGVILQTGALTATVDYWYYRLKDQITLVPADIVARAAAGAGDGTQFVDCSNPLRGLLVFDNNNSCVQGVTQGNNIQRVRSDTTNGPTVKTDGLDFDVNYRFDDLWGGRLDVGGTATHVFHYKQSAFNYAGVEVSPAYEAAGFTNYDRLPGTISKWRAQLYADFARGRHNLRWTTNYVKGVKDNRGGTVVQSGPTTTVPITFGLKVDDFITHDINYRVELDHGITINATVFNILDEDPPAARLQMSYDPFIGNPLGRTYKINIKKTF